MKTTTNPTSKSGREMEHPVTGAKFNLNSRMWIVIVDTPSHPKYIRYPGSGDPLYTFIEAVKVVRTMCNGVRDAWLESEHMRMDLIAAEQSLEDIQKTAPTSRWRR